MVKALVVTIQQQFSDACLNNNLIQVKALYNQYKKEISLSIDKDHLFYVACCDGHVDLAQWLYGLGGVDIHAENDFTFRIACCTGYFDLAQWLYGLGGVDIHADNDYALIQACNDNCIEVVTWLFTLTTFELSTLNFNEDKIKAHDSIQKLLVSNGYICDYFTVFKCFDKTPLLALKNLKEKDRVYLMQLAIECFRQDNVLPLNYLKVCPEWQKPTVITFIC